MKSSKHHSQELQRAKKKAKNNIRDRKRAGKKKQVELLTQMNKRK